MFIHCLPRTPVPRRLVLAACSALATLAIPTVRADDDGTHRGGFRPRAVAITGATLVAAPGETLADGTLVIRDGRVAAAGNDVVVPIDAHVIDGKGLFVYPGLIDAGADGWLDSQKLPQPLAGRDADFQRDALAATRADNRRGLTPEFESQTALKTDPGPLAAAHTAGFTILHVVPDGPIAAGRSCVLALSGVPAREAVLANDAFSVFVLAPPGRGGGSSTTQYPTTLMGVTAHLRQAFLDARHHADHRQAFENAGAAVPRPPHDPALESLSEVLQRRQQTLFLAQSRDEIDRALDVADEHGLRPVLLGGRDAAECIDRLQSSDTAVVLQVNLGKKPEVEAFKPADKLSAEVNPPTRAQQDELDRWVRRFGTAAKLREAGVRFAFSTRGLSKPEEFLPQVRLLVEHGLSPDAALSAMTIDAARLLGLEDHLGTLERGKLGHVVVMTGPWTDKSSKVRYAIIDGRTFEYHKDAKPGGAQDGETSETPQLAGKWRLQIDSGDMRTTAALLELAQSGRALSGTFESEHGRGKLTSGKVTHERKAEFTVAIGAGDRSVELKFSGEATQTEGAVDELKGTLSSPFGAPTNWTAARVKEDGAAPANPVQLAVETGDKPPHGQPESTAAAEFPTELDRDRRKRPVATGGKLLLTNATVITGTGATLADTDVLIRAGRIAAVGQDLTAEEGVHVIDATGRYVMPGMIDTHSHIMIAEGVNEASESIVPEVRIKDVVRSDDNQEYRALAGGLTTARLLHGSANVIGGQDAVVKLKHGLSTRAHILHDAPQGVKFALGENVKARTGRFPNTRMGVEATLKRAFFEAIDYRRRWQEYERAVEKGAGSHFPTGDRGGPTRDENDSRPLFPPRRDLRLEALADIVEHQKFIHSHCYRADEILMLLRNCEQLGIRVWSLQHVLEGYKIAPEIVAHGASCSTFSDWWAYKIEAYDATPYNASLLQQAGANIVIKSDNAELMRHMNHEAAKSLRYGNMPADYALRMVTLNAAQELGLHDRIGSIEVGKDGDLAVFSAHPLDAFARCELTIIEGEVCFQRDQQPTVMTEEAARRTAPPLLLAAEQVRAKRLELPRSINGVYAITGATLHPVDAADIEGGTLLIADGRIAAVGRDVDVPGDAAVVDATGLHVYPGLIDAGTTLGLTEIRQIPISHDENEGGRFQPDLRAGIAVNVDSELIPVARAGGITTAFLRPQGSVISGQYSLIQTAGWTAEQMALEHEAGLSLDWPNDENRQTELKQFLKDARLYDRIRSAQEQPPSRSAPSSPAVPPMPAGGEGGSADDEATATAPDGVENQAENRGSTQKTDALSPIILDPRFEAMRPYVNGRKRVFVEANSRKEITQALLFAEEEKLRIVITGGADAWKLAGELKHRDVPVIVGPTMRNPVEAWDPFDSTYANPGRLHDAGVQFCIRSDNASNSRNAPFEAAIAVAYGLPGDEGLKSVTLNAAKILGMDDRLGSITPGKTASLILTDGNPLQHTTQIKAVFVAGQPFAPESRQTRFYERYLQRLEPTK